MNMQKTGQGKDQAGKFIPASVRRRMDSLNDIVTELNRRRFRSLDETDPQDLRRVIFVVQEMFPENTNYKIAEYAKVAIQLWRKARRGS